MFFPKPDSPTPSPFSFTRADNKLNEAGSGPWSTQVSVHRGTTTISMASDAREVRGDYTKYQGDNKTKTSNAAIQEAAYQVALATRAIVHEEVSLLDKACKSPDHPAPPWMSKAYMPLIATTAKLFRVDFQSPGHEARFRGDRSERRHSRPRAEHPLRVRIAQASSTLSRGAIANPEIRQ